MTENIKKITVVTPCYNEEGNIAELCLRVKSVMTNTKYNYDHLVIDNCSTDNTIEVLREISKTDKSLKVIVNSRNFGHIRSPYYAILQSNSDAVVVMASDLQDPPELIPDFIAKWEAGFKSVFAVKPSSEEARVMFFIRKIYYKFLSKISEVPLILNATGAGLFDKCVIDQLRLVDDPYPYLRGLICEIGYPVATVDFKQPRRKRGITKNNFYTLYDIAMLGIANHSKVPLRMLTMFGFAFAFLSAVASVVYLIAKLFLWETFQLGVAPILIGMFFFGSIQMLSIGILGEYISSIHTKVRKIPLVVESERINF